MTDPIGWVEVGETGGDAVAYVHGEIDISNTEEISKALEAATEGRRRRCFVDLSHTTYLDSSGIRILFALAARLRTRRQELHVIVPENAPTRRVLELTDLPRMIPTLTSLADIDPEG
jgi:anti-anti-sigma factor